MSGLLFHPAERGLLYARTDVGGAYRLEPASGRWLPLNDDLGREDAALLGVASFAIDARDPERLYLACGQYLHEGAALAAVLRSADRGRSWARTPLPFRLGGNSDGRSAGERLQVDPHVGEHLFLGTQQDGLWTSTDRGATWSRATGFPAERVTFITLDPRSGDEGRACRILYAGLDERAGPALLRSNDGGRSWSAVAGGPARLLPRQGKLDTAGDLYLVYADALGPNGIRNGAVWRFRPTSGEWAEVTPLRPSHGDTFGYGGLAVDGRAPGVVVVSTLCRWTHGDEIWRSTDGGTSWQSLVRGAHFDAAHAPWTYWQKAQQAFRPHWIGDVEIDPFQTGHIQFVTGGGIWRTTDAARADTTTGSGTTGKGGKSESVRWTFFNHGLEETVPLGLASPPVGAPLVSVLGDIDGFRHDDLTISPPRGQHEPAHGTSRSLDYAELAPEIFVRLHHGPTRGAWSADGAGTWRDFATCPPAMKQGPGELAVSADGTRFLWLPQGGSAFVSTDRGGSWSASTGSPRDGGRWAGSLVAADRAEATRFYLYEEGRGRFYGSDDGGVSFQLRATGLPPEGRQLRAVPGRRGELWLATERGLLRSTDGGATFAYLGAVRSAVAVGFGKAAPGRDHPTVFLAGLVYGVDGLFRSDDVGATWVRIDDDTRRYGWVSHIIGDPRIYGRAYIGTSGRGILYGEPDRFFSLRP